jgi:hypothetical protein
MRRSRMSIADLDQETLTQLQAFEEELGFYLVALAPKYKLAELSADQVEKVQSMEQKLGLVLLAYQKDN